MASDLQKAKALIDAAKDMDVAELDFSGLHLATVPDSITQIQQLASFRWQDSDVATFPEPLLNLPHLEVIDMSGNQIIILPDGIGKLLNLKFLRLGSNRLLSLPPTIRNLNALEELDLSSNHLDTFPNAVLLLTNLRKLELTGNKLSRLPQEIGRLSNLTHLLLAHNRLTAIPNSIGTLAKLSLLSLAGNRIQNLPASLGDLASLGALTLDNNPLSQAISAARNSGLPAIRTYLRSIKDGQVESLSEAKLLLLGEGGVGKSSLLAALRGERFDPDRRTTHGIEISKIDATNWASQPSQPAADLGEIPARKLVLNSWDLGGQEVYRITHQFYFSQRSLFLVLWSPRMSEGQCDVRGWIERIRVRVGASARVAIVATHADEDRLIRIDKESINREFPDIVLGFREVDNRTRTGIEELKQFLAKAALELPQMSSPISPRWLRVRDDVIASREARMPMEAFRGLCERHGVPEHEASTLAQFLSELGYVIYYGDDDGLKNEIILQPQWLAKAISYVLEDKETNKDAGVLPHGRLRRIWLDNNNPLFEKYPERLHPYFLRLMEKFDVSYRLDEHTSLVPQLVPILQPELPWRPDEESPISSSQLHRLKVICALDSTPPGIIPWLIVRTHRYASATRRHWTGGMFLDYDDHGSALIDLRERELHIEVRAQYPQHFMSILLDVVKQLVTERWHGLTYSETVPCPTLGEDKTPCRGRFKLKALRDHQAKGRLQFPCQECMEEPEIDSLLLGFGLGNSPLCALLRNVVWEGVDAIRGEVEGKAMLLYRTMIKLLSAEAICPRLFTIIPNQKGIVGRFFAASIKARLTLWCQYPDGAHPVCPIGSGGFVNGEDIGGEYTFDVPNRTWLKQIAPYARAAAAILKWIPKGAIPLYGEAVDHFEEWMEDVAAMERLFPGEGLLTNEPGDVVRLKEVEGAALRELHSLLLTLDGSCKWGGLRSFVNSAGDRLWLCESHYRLLEPGIPQMPQVPVRKAP